VLIGNGIFDMERSEVELEIWEILEVLWHDREV